jgi:large subunit ribosomal protein L25
MSEQRVLVAEKRERAGKGAARAVRREGRVPGVIYGGKATPVMVSFKVRDIVKAYHTGTFLRELCQIEVDGKQTRVLPREVQVHPVNDTPMHVDLLRLEKGARLNIEVEVHFIGQEESPGLTRGGVLNVVRYTVELNVSVDAIPEFIEADISELDIGGSVHISAIKLPEGCRPTITDRDFTVATVAAPTLAITDDVEEDEDGVEGEEGAEDAEGSEEATEEGGGE